MKPITAAVACLLCLVSHSGIAAEAEEIKKQIQQVFQGRSVENVEASHIQGLYRVSVEGRIFYTDGQYLIKGDIYDLSTMNNITNQSMLEAIADNEAILFPADGEMQNTITVFTDTTCGYCRKLHQEMDQLNAAGITVRYLLYPRAGLESPAARQLESVWCADNSQQALTQAKAGKSVPDKRCENPLEKHVELAHQFGLRGTPLILTDRGEKINGYLPADELIQRLN